MLYYRSLFFSSINSQPTLLVIWMHICLKCLNVAYNQRSSDMCIRGVKCTLYLVENMSQISHLVFTIEKPRDLIICYQTKHTNLGVECVLDHCHNVSNYANFLFFLGNINISYVFCILPKRLAYFKYTEWVLNKCFLNEFMNRCQQYYSPHASNMKSKMTLRMLSKYTYMK